VIEAAKFPGRRLQHFLAHGDLPIARDNYFAVPPDAQDSGGTNASTAQ
jgi:hypothetical protein